MTMLYIIGGTLPGRKEFLQELCVSAFVLPDLTPPIPTEPWPQQSAANRGSRRLEQPVLSSRVNLS